MISFTWFALLLFGAQSRLHAVDRAIILASNTVIRIMAGNLTGSSQKYEANSIRIFQGLKPDVVG